MFGGIFNHEARFFTDGYELSGVESVDFSYNNAANILKPLGTKRGATTASGPTQQTLAFSRVLTYDDPIIGYASDTPMSGSVFYDDRYYGFDTGYLTDYSVNCAVGAVPRVSCNFQIASEMKSGVDASLPVQQHPDIDIPTQGSISITCDGSTTNRVVGFDYGIKCNRKAYYSIGSNEVKKVELIQPMEYNATVQIEVDDAFLSDAYNFFSDKETKNISLDIKGRTGAQIQTALIPNATLVGESLNVGADGIAKVTLNYIGHSGIFEPSQDSKFTYVYDENDNVLESTLNQVPYQWMEGSGDIYNVSFGQDCSYISGYAFSGCSNLGGDIHIGVVGDYSGIGEAAFADCTGLDGELYIPSSAQIGSFAFYGCENLRGNLNILGFGQPQAAGDSIFENCSGFDGNLTYPAPNNFNVSKNSFKNCSNLIGNLTIPSGVTDYNIESGAFENCSGFDGNISIGDKNVLIGDNAFKNCSNLIGELNLPSTNTSIGDGAFENCSKIKSLDLSSNISYLGDNAFKNCSEIGGAVDLTNLATVGSGTFENCKKLKTIKLEKPNIFEGFGNRAFYNCEGLFNFESVDSFKYVDYIGEESFMNCSNLVLDADFEFVTGIGNSAFENCENIYNSRFLDLLKAENVGKRAFYGCSSITGDLFCGVNFSVINDETFKNCGFRGSLSFDYASQADGLTYADQSVITHIGKSAFENCDFSSRLTLPVDLESVGDKAFKDCTSFTGRLVMPTGVTGIGDRAFYNCNSIKDVILDHPTGTFKGERAFEGIQGCMYVTPPYVDDYVSGSAGFLFQGMPICIGSLDTKVYNASTYAILAETDGDVVANFWSSEASPTSILSIGFNATEIGLEAFYFSTALSGSLRIPSSVKDVKARAFEGCDNFDGRLIIEDGVEFFGDDVFKDCSNFSGSLTIPQSVMNIGNNCFQNCSSFDGNLFINTTGTQTIQDGAFKDCSGFIGDVTIPDGVSQIGVTAFENCSSFDGTLSLPEGLTSIGAGAFKNCSSLVGKVSFPKVLESIGNNAFDDCSNIEDVVFGDSPLIIGNRAFRNCSSLSKPIVIGAKVTSVGDSAFFGCSNVPAIYVDVPHVQMGSDALRLQNPAQTIMYVRTAYASEYIAAGGDTGFYEDNLILTWEDDERPTRVYDSDLNPYKETYETTLTTTNIGNFGGLTNYYLLIGYNAQIIDDDCFSSDSRFRGVINIPSNIKTIGDRAFYNNISVDAFIFNEGLQYIGSQAFALSSNLTSGIPLVLPSTLEFIGDKAFEDWFDLDVLKVGNDVAFTKTEIGSEAFAGSQPMMTAQEGSSVEIYKSVSSIGSNCFKYSRFKTALIKANIIKSSAFEFSNFQYIHFTDDVKTFEENCVSNVRPTSTKPLTIEIGVDGGSSQDIGPAAFRGVTSINDPQYSFVDLFIKDSVNVIGSFAFQGKTGEGTSGNDRSYINLLNVNARRIGLRAFYNHSAPEGITFGKNVQIIEQEAFREFKIVNQDLVFEYYGIRIDKEAFGAFSNTTSQKNEVDNVYVCSNYINSTDKIADDPVPYVNVGRDSGDSENKRSFFFMKGDFFVHRDFLLNWPNKARRGNNLIDLIDVREWENYPIADGQGQLRSDIAALEGWPDDILQ